MRSQKHRHPADALVPAQGFVLPAVILPAPAVPVHVRAVVPARAQKAVPMIALVLAPALA